MREFTENDEKFTMDFLNNLSAKYAYIALTDEDIEKIMSGEIKQYSNEMLNRGFFELPIMILHCIENILHNVKNKKQGE